MAPGSAPESRSAATIDTKIEKTWRPAPMRSSVAVSSKLRSSASRPSVALSTWAYFNTRAPTSAP
jgi:hypothetical protein